MIRTSRYKLAGACLINICAYPGATFGWALYVRSIEQDLQVTSKWFGYYWCMAAVFSCLLLPIIGQTVDKCGPYKVIRAGFLPFILILGLGGHIVNKPVTLVLEMLFLRIFGSSGLLILSSKLVNTWFDPEVKGTATVFTFGSYFLTLTFLGPINIAIKRLGWRRAPFVEAAWCFMLLVVSLFFIPSDSDERGPPVLEQKNSKNGATTIVFKETIGNPLKTALFWLITVCGMFNELLDCGLMSLAAQLTEISIGHYVLYMGSNLMGIIIAGYFLNNYGATGRIYVLVSTMLMLTLLCVLSVIWPYGIASAIYTLGVVLGSSGGVYNQVLSIIFADFFGNVDSAYLYGVALSCTSLMTGAGPLIFDYISHISVEQGKVRIANELFIVLGSISVLLGAALVLVFQVLWKPLPLRSSFQKFESLRSDVLSIYTPLLSPISPALVPQLDLSSDNGDLIKVL